MGIVFCNCYHCLLKDNTKVLILCIMQNMSNLGKAVAIGVNDENRNKIDEDVL